MIDHYENIYVVVAGEKHFTLYPPTDILYLPESKYKQAHYKENPSQDGFDVIDEEPEMTVPWYSTHNTLHQQHKHNFTTLIHCNRLMVDPDKEDGGGYPHYDKATPIRCVVRAGEILYLPSLWFHHVKQKEDEEGLCIAVYIISYYSLTD